MLRMCDELSENDTTTSGTEDGEPKAKKLRGGDEIDGSTSILNAIKCDGCYAVYPPHFIFGGKGELIKACLCQVTMCGDCLKIWARQKIRSREKTICPGVRCDGLLSAQLIDHLFQQECLLCQQQNQIPVSCCCCPLSHSFCQSCLLQSVIADINTGRAPSCPRVAECRYL